MREALAREPAKAIPVLAHASAWIVYGSFIHIANYLADPHIKIINTVFYLVPFCLTFYTSIYCLNLYKRKGVSWSIASFFIVFIVMASIGYGYIYLLLPMSGIKLYSSDNFRDFVKYAVLGYVQYFSYALLYFYVVQSFNKERQLRRLQEDKLRNELENAVLKQQELRSQQDKLQLEYAFMRAQVNPHFLHNTLNVLFAQAMEYSQELAENISKLSRMMRYSMESVEHETDKVPVKKELENLQLLIEINKIRFDDKVVHLAIEGETDGLMLPPLSMITIVENAFKYGDLKDSQYPLLIKVLLRYRQIYFYCRNKKRKDNPELSSGNIGISNLGKRLDVGFKNRYEMKVNDGDDFYTFELTINN
ncbi:sensor histidine kinase [Terrimonas pollutisoli]|uniref:sensor histidine kinase n=1 Tax=Terrimonas pollutisoli TaxID=3034147 RepID=UPI0023ECF251|nr:sensor histidine kinase [Terrimonas sp. H1YJ31]